MLLALTTSSAGGTKGGTKGGTEGRGTTGAARQERRAVVAIAVKKSLCRLNCLGLSGSDMTNMTTTAAPRPPRRARGARRAAPAVFYVCKKTKPSYTN